MWNATALGASTPHHGQPEVFDFQFELMSLRA
jgi:hypothetical protein